MRRLGCFLQRWSFYMRFDGWEFFDRRFHKSVQLKLFAKARVKHAGGNEAAHSAQGNSFTHRITQPGRLRCQCVQNRFRHPSRIVSVFDVLQSRDGQTLSFVRVSVEEIFAVLAFPLSFVLVYAGSTNSARTPNLLTSWSSVSVYPSTACLLAA